MITINNKCIKHLTDAELDACILINPELFGEMMLEEMGITGRFSSLRLEDSAKGEYRIAWTNGNYHVYSSVISKYDIKGRLGNKEIRATVVKT